MTLVNPPLIAIIGPTASGKSDLAIKLGQRFRGAVISADSQQIYQNSSIGTNQPHGRRRTFLGKPVLMVQGVPHFLVGTLNPARQFTAVKFQKEVLALAQRLWRKGYLPILTGGTGLYVSAVVECYQFPLVKKNQGLRRTLERKSLAQLLRELKRLDVAGYARTDKQNKRRVIRALEHVQQTGLSLFSSQSRIPRTNTLVLGVAPNDLRLRKNIERRTRTMFRRGLVAETKKLTKLYPRSLLFSSIGYREVKEFLNHNISRAEAERLITTHTRQYAKRQMTWFKRMPNVRWVNSYAEARTLVQNFVAKKH